MPTQSPLNLAALLDEPIDFRFRSFPTSPKPIRIGDVGAQKWGLFDSGFFFPLLALRSSAMGHNVATMAAYCRERDVSLAPHGKTTMAPQIFARQLAAGAWGITAATAQHARTYRAFGVPRILMANELARADEARWVRAELESDPGFDFIGYVDSPASVRILSNVFAESHRPARVLLEVGTPGGRAGLRTDAEALALASEAASAPGVELAGVAGFEGILGSDRSRGAVEAVDAFCERLVGLTRDLDAAGLVGASEWIVSAGGSAYPDRVVEKLAALARADRRVRVVIRSGCYVTHDDGVYERVSPFASASEGPHLRPAFELWAAVLSRPEPELALVGFGKRDAPFDADLPVPRIVRSGATGAKRPAHTMKVLRLNDQHAYLSVPAADPLAPGDLLMCGVSHPCLAFDKWPLIPLVDDRDVVVEAIRTFF
jgi:D-serine deaminase-like pyridoxal phosphate-dependent protein